MKFGLSFVIKNWSCSTWLVHYLTLQQLYRIFKNYVRKGGITFDIGCSRKPYSALILQFSSKYFGLEHKYTIHQDNKADLIGTAYNTGVKDRSVDTVFTAAVLEHLEEPSRALNEMYRILKPGGLVVLSAPLFWHIHEAPRDFYRYTRYGFQYLLNANGFEIIEIKPLSGFWVTFLIMLSNQLSRFNKGFIRFIPIIPVLNVLIQFIAFLLNRIDYKGDIWTWAYIAVGRKPEK